MTKTIETRRRRGLTGKTTLTLDKLDRSTDIKVVNVNSYGERRQITFNLNRKDRQDLIEALLDHHEMDAL